MRLRAYGVQCLSWDPSSAQWRAEGCKVGPQSRQEPGGHCLCSHLSVFGASFWVAPVQMDLVCTAEYFGRVSQNPVLAILLGVLYGLFLVGLTWACWMDTREPAQVGAALLPEEDPCAQYVYLLSVTLQEPPGPGNSPRLSISLQGSFGTSKPRRLPCQGTFLLREPCPLGELQGIWLWQESLGVPQRPRYVSGIAVWDLPQRRHFRFPCNAWLAAREDGLSTPQHFPTAPPEEPFWPVFRQRALSGLWEEHTVLLVLRPPPRSPFTRAQRLSCAWSLLLCSALISLMFWESPQGDSTPLLLDAGSVFSLSWKDVVIGVQSALLAFPINFLVIFIFQRSKTCKRRRGPGQGPPTMPSAPNDLTSLQAVVLEHLRSAVEVLSRGPEQSEPRQAPLPPTLGFEELLQLLHHFILGGGRGGTANGTARTSSACHAPEAPAYSSDCAQPSILPGTAGPTTAPSSLHETYCTRFLLLKLQRVERLLEEVGAGCPTEEGALALQRVQEMGAALAKRLPTAQPSCRNRWCQWRLPWWGSLVGWALLLSLNAASAFFILLYGFHYGKESTERWLVSTAISLGQSLLVLQPFKVVCFAIFFALVLKKAEEEEPAVEESLDQLEERLGSFQ
ncbi:polycystin-1-like protein 2 [Anolis carolinensis]|uniref:polycystin-1-like protein 2 n=1 Tax=Anolis carolinensis TaxID=28377 RepID=UPI002F2B2F8B